MGFTADDVDYPLPPELIAQAPLPRRDASRLLHLELDGGHHHRAFRELPSLLRRGDVLVFNDSRVIPARLVGHKEATGGRAELLLVRPEADEPAELVLGQAIDRLPWICMGQASKGLKAGTVVALPGGLRAHVLEDRGGGECLVRFEGPAGSLGDALVLAGAIPLPPYIARPPDAVDAERYQTVFAGHPGSVAAPTAGLHFTHEVLDELRARGVDSAFVTLDVGPGTFLPVRTADLAAHVMHAERAAVSEATASVVNRARSEGRRIIAVGTTAVRTLESLSSDAGEVRAGHTLTRLFITPGYRFKVVDGLVTNFHQPRSTLLMLVGALVGHRRLMDVYADAVAQRYRFLSYGDCMYIDPGESLTPARRGAR